MTNDPTNAPIHSATLRNVADFAAGLDKLVSETGIRLAADYPLPLQSRRRVLPLALSVDQTSDGGAIHRIIATPEPEDDPDAEH